LEALASCNKIYSPELEAVLQQAGANRAELEKTLQRYSDAPFDSLKLRAAEFLILNMPGKYSEYYDEPWNDVAAMRMRWTSSPDKQLIKWAELKSSNPYKLYSWTASGWKISNVSVSKDGKLHLRIPLNSPCCLRSLRSVSENSHLFIAEKGGIRWL